MDIILESQKSIILCNDKIRQAGLSHLRVESSYITRFEAKYLHTYQQLFLAEGQCKQMTHIKKSLIN